MPILTRIKTVKNTVKIRYFSSTGLLSFIITTFSYRDFQLVINYLLFTIKPSPVAKIVNVKIHPAIGVARIGNHPEDFYIGPETHNQFINNDEIGGFKVADPDDHNVLKIKRQGARFRVFAYFDDRSIKEVNGDGATIDWRVNIANTKASAPGFHGTMEAVAPDRNSGVTGADRKGLEFNPGEISISGVNKTVDFAKSPFVVKIKDKPVLQSDPVYLGSCKTDELGRLIVLGGHGNSGFVGNAAPLRSYCNNDFWYDDISDGYVHATVMIDGTNFEAVPAWVFIAPPKFVPSMHPIITMYDTLFSKFFPNKFSAADDKPSFYADIYPIIKRALNVQWLFDTQGMHNFDALLKPTAPAGVKRHVFGMLRKIGDTDNNTKMPLVFGDDYPNRGLTLTPVQLNIMQKWIDGNFITDDISVLQPSADITAAGMDMAALENCIGGAFYPGIEASYHVRDLFQFTEPFRFDPSGMRPGIVSEQMALPWQADFMDCTGENSDATGHVTVGWWPFARPDQVFPDGSDTPQPWANFGGHLEMVQKWSTLGFIVEKSGKYVQILTS